MTRTSSEPLRTFCSYAHEDKVYVRALRTWLRQLERQRLIEWWYDREIIPGQEWREAIDENLQVADVIFLLISPDFIASDFAYEEEMQRAIARHEQGEARVIPIIVRHTDLEGAPFRRLQSLPEDLIPIAAWSDQDEAWLDVIRGIRRVVEDLTGEVRQDDLSAIAEECLDLLHIIKEANARVLDRIDHNGVAWQPLAGSDYNAICGDCEDLAQSRSSIGPHLDTVCTDPEVQVVCKHKWYLGERLAEYERLFDQHLRELRDVTEPPLSPQQLDQAITAAIRRLNTVLSES
jgi:hypothetical protein